MRDGSAELTDAEVSDTSPDSDDVEQFGAERPTVFERAIDCFEPARTVLFVCIVVWIAWFFRLPLVRHERFQTFGFDLGIYDQGVWLLSQFRDPFVTVRGLDLFGHHMNPFLLVLAPFYRAGGGVEFLLAVQVLAQASGAIAIFLLGRDLLRSRWCGVALAIALLLNPTYQWLMWEFFHPDAVAIGPLLFAYWAARERRWTWFTVAAVIALSCKEDVALAVVVLGLLVAFRLRGDQRRLAFGLGSMVVGCLVPVVIPSSGDWKFLLAAVFVLVGLYLVLDRRDDWRIGTAIALLAGAWFLLATQILIPHFNGVGRFYDSFFGPELGETPSEIAKNIAQHPSLAVERITESSRQTWYWRMLAPFALLPLVYLRAFAIALPMVAVNVLTLFPYTRDYRFHYSALVVAGGAVASVEAIAWMQRVSGGSATVRNAGVSIVVIAALGDDRRLGCITTRPRLRPDLASPCRHPPADPGVCDRPGAEGCSGERGVRHRPAHHAPREGVRVPGSVVQHQLGRARRKPRRSGRRAMADPRPSPSRSQGHRARERSARFRVHRSLRAIRHRRRRTHDPGAAAY